MIARYGGSTDGAHHSLVQIAWDTPTIEISGSCRTQDRGPPLCWLASPRILWLLTEKSSHIEYACGSSPCRYKILACGFERDVSLQVTRPLVTTGLMSLRRSNLRQRFGVRSCLYADTK